MTEAARPPGMVSSGGSSKASSKESSRASGTGSSTERDAESDSSQSARRVREADGGQEQDMRRRLTPEPDDVDLRDQSAQDEAPQEENAAVANPRRTRR